MLAMETNRISEVVGDLHNLLESKQVGGDIAIISLVSTAGEVVLSLIVAQPELKEAYLKVFNNAVEQIRRQIAQELEARNI